MIVEIDINNIIKLGITSHQFVIVYLLYIRQYDLLDQYLKVIEFEGFREDIQALIDKGYIEPYNYDSLLDLKGYYITPKFQDLVKIGDFFDELLEFYPIKVIRPDGLVDYLRTDLSRCRTKYNRLTSKKKVVHNNILKCLKLKVQTRTDNGQLKFMKKLPKWLEAEEWKVWEQVMLDKKETKSEENTGYGTNLE